MNIFYTSKFAREYRKLPEQIKNLAEKQEQLFRQNPFAPALKTHKLGGKLKEFWSFSVGYRHRIIFEFGDKEKETIYFLLIGTHEIYQ